MCAFDGIQRFLGKKLQRDNSENGLAYSNGKSTLQFASVSVCVCACTRAKERERERERERARSRKRERERAGERE